MVRDLLENPGVACYPEGFLDDDPGRRRMRIRGAPVVGTIDDVAGVARSRGVREAIIAIPSADRRAMRQILRRCREAQVTMKIVPGLQALLTGWARVSEVRLEDLLRREPVRLDAATIRDAPRGRGDRLGDQRRGEAAAAASPCWAALSASRWRKGSEYRCDRSQRIISSWFMPAISLLSRSRICRMVWTQSKDLDLDSFIAWNLPRGPDLQKRVAVLEVDSVVCVDSPKVDDVLEVPADEDIDSRHRCKRDVQGIGNHAFANGAIRDVRGGQFLRLRRNRECFDMRFGHAGDVPSYFCRRNVEFAEGQL